MAKEYTKYDVMRHDDLYWRRAEDYDALAERLTQVEHSRDAIHEALDAAQKQLLQYQRISESGQSLGDSLDLIEKLTETEEQLTLARQEIRELYELVAVTNRDGGHYREQYGTKAAVARGIANYGELAKKAGAIRQLRGVADAAAPVQPDVWTAEDLAARFHEAYERLAPQFGYSTRDETKMLNLDAPNGKLMLAVCRELLTALSTQARGDK